MIPTFRASLGALLVLGASATLLPAEAATTRQHYQRQASLDCSGGCVAVFPKLAANQALDIDHVGCQLNTTGDVLGAYVMLLPQSLSFNMPLDLLWKATSGNLNIFTMGGEVNVRVPLGKQAQIGIVAGGSPIGTCSITGTLLINS